MKEILTFPDRAILAQRVERMATLAAEKSRRLAARWKPVDGAPVFTANGLYRSRGWTEWTQGFQFGIPLLAYEMGQGRDLFEYAEHGILERMAVHLTHRGVHDHGFNNVSTYGNYLRLMTQGLIDEDVWKRRYMELALKVSGAVQASRWTALAGSLGYIYSFNGPHSLFADTIRSLRSLALSWMLGHSLGEEQDAHINLLERLLAHAESTARWNVYLGTGRDRWDIRGRVVHESVFNVVNGSYRCPSSQQGYSPFTTWTRGLAWVMLGFAEELEFVEACVSDADIAALALPYFPDKSRVIERFLDIATATCDYYLSHTPADGIPYWDTGGPQLYRLPDALERDADPYNPWEPVDASAAAIAAQALMRLGTFLECRASNEAAASASQRYLAAGLAIMSRLCESPYLSENPGHEGLLLHAVYHYPNGWDHAEAGTPPRGESCLWGDYHVVEAGLWVQRWLAGTSLPRFFDIAAVVP